jgi:hypothetical protein
MAMVGFSFTKISAERKPASNSAINIESNAGVTNVIELPVIEPKKALLKFEFVFTVKYEPGIGKIEFNGEVVQLYDKEYGLKVIDHWAKNKKLPGEIMPEVFNNILARSNVEAIVLSRDMGLPSPIQMPRVDVKPKDGSKTEKSEPKEPKAEKAKK